MLSKIQYLSKARPHRICREILAVVVGGPTLLISYSFVLWSLAADLGFTNSFLWSEGPLRNWIVWLLPAVLLTFASRVARAVQ